jgi:DNA-binding NtrC family response regulator
MARGQDDPHSSPREAQLAIRVLVVDDDQVVRTVVADYLRTRGYEINEAGDGVEALDSIRQAVPDVVVTDLGMPRLDGLGLLRALARSDPDLPAIVLTAHDSVGEMIQAIREGILFDYQIKPPDLRVVDMAVRRAADVRILRARAREADQVTAMRELAVTAADRILNPCHVISLTLASLEKKGYPPEATAQTATRIKAEVGKITRVVQQMRSISRYAPSEIAEGLREIDLDRATADEAPGGDSTNPSPS